MKPKSKESHSAPFTITGLPLKQPGVFCPRELANFQRHAIQYLYEFIMVLGKIIKKPFLYLPEIGTLASKICPVGELRKTAMPMPLKVLVNPFISIKSQVLSDYFHCNYFIVAELRQGPSFPQSPRRKKSLNNLKYVTLSGCPQFVHIGVYLLETLIGLNFVCLEMKTLF